MKKRSKRPKPSAQPGFNTDHYPPGDLPNEPIRQKILQRQKLNDEDPAAVTHELLRPSRKIDWAIDRRDQNPRIASLSAQHAIAMKHIARKAELGFQHSKGKPKGAVGPLRNLVRDYWEEKPSISAKEISRKLETGIASDPNFPIKELPKLATVAKALTIVKKEFSISAERESPPHPSQK